MKRGMTYQRLEMLLGAERYCLQDAPEELREIAPVGGQDAYARGWFDAMQWILTIVRADRDKPATRGDR